MSRKGKGESNTRCRERGSNSEVAELMEANGGGGRDWEGGKDEGGRKEN